MERMGKKIFYFLFKQYNRYLFNMDNLSTILADFNNGSEKMRYFSISYKKLISLK